MLEIEADGHYFVDTETGQWQWRQAPNDLLESEKGLGFGFLGQEVIATLHLEETQKFFGLGEKTGPLNRRGSGFTNWNTDYYGYPTHADMIYASFPFYIGLVGGDKLKPAVYGIFLDNGHKSHFNFGASNDRFIRHSGACCV
jgi:alpha-glucosidase